MQSTHRNMFRSKANRKQTLKSSPTRSRTNRNGKIAREIKPMLELMESRRLMSTLNVFDGSNVTLGVTPSGGIETIIDGNKTDYSAGQYGNVLVDISGSLTIKATV